MGYAEKRGKFWRARWRSPSGKLESMPGFQSKKAAEKYAAKQEALIEEGRYIDPKAGQITLTEWVNLWYPTLDLELSSLSSIRYYLEGFALVEFGERSLASIQPEEIVAWEKGISDSGYSRRVAQGARTTLATCLGDAVPARIPRNPALRGRARGKKATRRVAQKLAVRRAWATPLEAVLIAERVAALSGCDADFVKIISTVYTGTRWSEITGLPVDCVREHEWDLDWKLYELDGKFYRGYPKDGSIRTVDVPPFLDGLVATHLKRQASTACTCSPDAEEPYCSGDRYVFLGPQRGHARRSNFSRRFFRPALDAQYPGQGGKRPRPELPVFVDVSRGWPGVPLASGVSADGEPFAPLARVQRQHDRLPVNTRSGKPALVEYAVAQGLADAEHLTREQLLDRFVRCSYVSQDAVAAWLPVIPGLTHHGLRHSLETWMAEDRIADVLRDERMGHTAEGDTETRRRMRDHYTHITPQMRGELVDALQRRWEQSLTERVELERHWHREAGVLPQSTVPLVNELLEPYRDTAVTSLRSRLAPKIGHRRERKRLTPKGISL